MTNSIERFMQARRRQAAADAERRAALVGYAITSATTSSASAAAPLRPSAGPGMGRWRVERAGSLTGGYGPGWFTYSGTPDLDAHGAWFPTWSEALAFADAQAV